MNEIVQLLCGDAGARLLAPGENMSGTIRLQLVGDTA